MELTKILNEMENFFKLVHAKEDNIKEITERLSKNVNNTINQLKVFSTVNQCTIPNRILKDFPDVKRRVIVNLIDVINEEIRMTDNVASELFDIIKELRKFHDKISRQMLEINWSEHASFFSGFDTIFEWTEKCWKNLQFLYINVSNGTKFLACDQSHSAMHLKRISEIRPFDNSILSAASNMSHLVAMLKSDVASRSQNIENYS